MENAGGKILTVEHLSVSFSQYGRGLRRKNIQVIRDLSLHAAAGEMVAVVGSSGSGKSLLAHAIMGILPYNSRMDGRMEFMGRPLTQREKENIRGREMFLVPQSVSYLDPLMRAGDQVAEAGAGKGNAARFRAMAVLERYGLGPESWKMYPFQLSGGMARRVLIATAVMGNPRLVIADEPTPGIPTATALRVLGHFREIADQGAGVLLITHDLELAVKTADRIVVLYRGTAVEEGRAEEFLRPEALRHPYTRALCDAMPDGNFRAIPGTQPALCEEGDGCPFAGRCSLKKTGICDGPIPYRPFRGGHVRCAMAGREENGGDARWS